MRHLSTRLDKMLIMTVVNGNGFTLKATEIFETKPFLMVERTFVYFSNSSSPIQEIEIPLKEVPI